LTQPTDQPPEHPKQPSSDEPRMQSLESRIQSLLGGLAFGGATSPERETPKKSTLDSSDELNKSDSANNKRGFVSPPNPPLPPEPAPPLPEEDAPPLPDDVSPPPPLPPGPEADMQQFVNPFQHHYVPVSLEVHRRPYITRSDITRDRI
jgi:hypothetical protein